MGGICSSSVSPEAGYEPIDKDKALGEGASCKVVAVRDKRTGEKFAMKILKHDADQLNQVMYRNEVSILKLLKHPNILEFIEAFEDREGMKIITRLCEGGELFDRVSASSQPFTEKVASKLTYEMLAAVAYCHKQSVVHRDLKPENFVFQTKDERSPMKLIDFGCAQKVHPDEKVSDVAGSPYYVAPEVLSGDVIRTGRIWQAADMWSIGVIIYLLVCGFPPFNSSSQDRIFDKIKKGKFRFPDPSKIPLSDSVKDLICKLLVMQPLDRFTAAEALQHPWISGDLAPDTPLPPTVVKSLNAFQNQCRLRKAVAKAMANRMSQADKDSLAVVFKKFDINGDGQLGPEEIAALMRHLGKTEEEAKALLRELDEDKNGAISTEEFATAHMMGKLGSSQKEIKATFDMFDADNDGYITRNELEKICEFLSPDVAQQLINEVDKDGDGKIQYEEWVAALADKDIIPGDGLSPRGQRSAAAAAAPAAPAPAAGAPAAEPQASPEAEVEAVAAAPPPKA